MKISGIRTKTLGSRLGIVSESESSSKPVQSRNQTQNRVLAMDSLGIGIGAEFLDWTVSEPESESKKLEPGTSDQDLFFNRVSKG